MNNFIANDYKGDLKKRLIELIKHSEELKFLVGFFYFSGIRELYEGLKANPNIVTKVLVGLNVDRLNSSLIEFGEIEEQSVEDMTYKYFESLKKSLNNENFDTEEFYQQVAYFIKLIRNGKIVIRKTLEPNHAKLYLFKLDQSQVAKKNLFITGSSNLTKAGLLTQNEFNVEISDYGFIDAEKHFDDLWVTAIKITEDHATKERLLDAIEKGTLVRTDVTPFEAYCLILKTYLDSFEQKETSEFLVKILLDNGYKEYKYQLDAVGQALAVIETNNGVIIADVVGLGKTIIACAVAKQLKKRGIIVCPPGIMGDRNKESGWEKYLEEFKLDDWEVRSLGDLENTLEFVKKHNDIEVVIIDEAHRFRNQDTQDYETLKNICREKIVILLTATPFNNRPGDILSLLKLFITPKKSAITLESDITVQFKSYQVVFERLGYIMKYHNSKNEIKKSKAKNFYRGLFEEENIDLTKVAKRTKYLAKQIRNVIEPVTIRRNRLDLQKNPRYKDEIKDLSKIHDKPLEWFFELDNVQSIFYDKIIKKYFGDPDNGGNFKGAIYRPFEYEQGRKVDTDDLGKEENKEFIQQKNLYEFMRRLIVKRFESSFGSFEQSIRNFKRVTIAAQEFIKRKELYILDRKLLESIYKLSDDDIEKSLMEYEKNIIKGVYPKSHKIYKLDNFKLKKEFIRHIQSDIELFNNILEELTKLKLVENDPKTACLIKHIKKEMAKKPNKGEPKRKYVIFTEYVDTVEYLGNTLKKHFDDRVLIIAGSLPDAKIKEINRNFDAAYKDQKDDYDILLSTDKLSEGFNLNRAGMVINYDIPWNPVRVIQRVGRINRISKKVFDELYIVNFFPSEKGAELVKSREIAANKMFLIHNTLGEDAKIFDEKEEPTPAGLYQRINQNPEANEEEGIYTKIFREYINIQKQHPDIIEKLNNYPARIKVAKKYTEDELLVFYKKGRLYVSVTSYDDKNKFVTTQTTLEDVLDKTTSKIDDQSFEISKNFWPAYESVKKYKNSQFNTPNENSLEQKALNVLDFFIKTCQAEKLMPLKDFLKMLKEDILFYGTLSDFTMRRIGNLPTVENRISEAIKDVQAIKGEIGGDYLDKEKTRQKEPNKEIIIAVENQKQ